MHLRAEQRDVSPRSVDHATRADTPRPDLTPEQPPTSAKSPHRPPLALTPVRGRHPPPPPALRGGASETSPTGMRGRRPDWRVVARATACSGRVCWATVAPLSKLGCVGSTARGRREGLCPIDVCIPSAARIAAALAEQPCQQEGRERGPDVDHVGDSGVEAPGYPPPLRSPSSTGGVCSDACSGREDPRHVPAMRLCAVVSGGQGAGCSGSPRTPTG